jgi:CRISPR-associated endonuclease Cas1
MASTDGVLLLSGYGLRLSVNRGHLVMEDGIADERRTQRLSRIDRTVKRLVILGEAGSVSLDAIGWLHRVGIPLVHLRPDGTLLFVAGPAAASHAPIRRAQALAAETGVGLRVSLDLIRMKIQRQMDLAATLPEGSKVVPEIRSRVTQLDTVRTSADLRGVEGHAAKAYWSAWKGLPIQLKASELKRCPYHWRTFGGRTSPLSHSHSPRRAVNPANAVLNYLYAILEAEARIATLAVGLDPMLGLLHSDHGARDSLALDLMEPVRPQVDAYVVDLLRSHTFARAEVFETVDGQCRLMPPLTRMFTATAARWARAMLPVAQQVAKQLLHDAQSQSEARPSGTVRRIRPQLRAARDFAPRLDKKDDPRYKGQSVTQRKHAVAQVQRANRRWERDGKPGMTREHYVKTVVPALAGVKLSALMAATGLTNASCSLIRRGLTVPHPRHWGVLAGLIGTEGAP